MSINRQLFKGVFQKVKVPHWICPSCRIGLLELRKGSFNFAESKPSRDAHDHYDWDPEWIEYSYSMILDCNNKECLQMVASCGNGGVEEEYINDDNGGVGQEYVDWFMPEYFVPSLVLFDIPKECPKVVSKEIKASFKLFFSDPASSANHIRQAVESMLTEEKIPRFEIQQRRNQSPRRSSIALHRRINAFANRNTQNSDIGNKLMALKWLGNAGSHSSQITKDDVLDAYEILEIALDEMYTKHRKAIEKKILLVNKRKGPVKRK